MGRVFRLLHQGPTPGVGYLCIMSDMNINHYAKRILIYGDSHTWGRIPNIYERYDTQTRWTGVLQQQLGTDYEIIEEGLRSRMAKGENPYVPDRDGYAQFPAIFSSHLPLDMVIFFLGTNDTNSRAQKTPADIAEDLGSYLPLVRETSESMGMQPPQHPMFIAPSIVDESVLKENSMFNGAGKKSQELPQLIKAMAEEQGVLFFDASTVVVPSKEDGVHLNAENNITLGKALAQFLREIF